MDYRIIKDLLARYGRGDSLPIDIVASRDVRDALYEVFEKVPQGVAASCQKAIDDYFEAMKKEKTGLGDSVFEWSDMADKFMTIGEMEQSHVGLAAGSLGTLAEMLDYTE